jgi:hypothetical protein
VLNHGDANSLQKATSTETEHSRLNMLDPSIFICLMDSRLIIHEMLPRDLEELDAATAGSISLAAYDDTTTS